MYRMQPSETGSSEEESHQALPPEFELPHSSSEFDTAVASDAFADQEEYIDEP